MVSILQPYETWNGIIVALSDGHGANTPGKRTPYIEELKRSIRENEFNEPVVDFLAELLRKNGFRVLHVSPTKEDTPLKTRTDAANKHKADIYVSIHYNAHDNKFNGPGKDAEGLEIFVFNGNLKYNSGKLASSVAKYLVQGVPQKWRGIKEANFHELRETKMPAILTECGFMDNKREALLMLDVNFQKEVAEEHARGICDYFGKTFKNGYSKPTTPVVEAKPEGQAPTTNQIKGDEKMNAFLSDYEMDRMADIYKKANAKGVLKSNRWEEKARNRTLTAGEAIYLCTVFEENRLDEKK